MGLRSDRYPTLNSAILLIGGMLGAIIGSFIAVLTERWPKGKGIGGRSACQHCGQEIQAFDLVPIFSHFALRGRCRTCQKAIGLRSLKIELVAALIGVSAMIAMPFPQSLWYCALGWVLLTLAILDLEHLWLPTLPIVLVLLSGIAEGAWIGQSALQGRLIGATVGFLSLEILRLSYRQVRKRDGMGAGDPKMLSALGAWTGWSPLPLLVLAACLTGIFWAVANRSNLQKVEGKTALPLGTLMIIVGYPALLITNAH
jgi:leader peptidase (prepilin peptidase) / N-methyltransferase